MMKEKLKWIWITTLIILVVSLILAFNLKSHYNHVHDKQKSKTNVQINNKNVKLYRDISYGKGIPNSKLDIITPADMSNDTKLPVIFGCMVEDLSLETNNIKSIIVKSCRTRIHHCQCKLCVSSAI